ncbi:MAG: hypothetical protein ACO3QC_14740, partial [Phycisphaerales bacterium]
RVLVIMVSPIWKVGMLASDGLVEDRFRTVPEEVVMRVAGFQVLSGGLVFGLAAILGGCGDQSYQEPRGGGYTPPPANNATASDDPLGTKKGANSAYGKARERAERLIEEDVAEYNKKLEDAADGKF